MKPYIPILVILLLVSASFVGVSNQTEDFVLEREEKTEHYTNHQFNKHYFPDLYYSVQSPIDEDIAEISSNLSYIEYGKGRFCGYIIDENLTPIVNAEIYIDDWICLFFTDENGYYETTNSFEEGWWNLQACAIWNKSQYSSLFKLIYLNEGETKWVNFTLPPNKPNIAPINLSIIGPTSCKIGKEYQYNFSAQDPDGDPFSFKIYWGDIHWEDGGWQGSLYTPDSEGKIHVNKTWKSRGNYLITIYAIDKYGAFSEPVAIRVRSRWFTDLFPGITVDGGFDAEENEAIPSVLSSYPEVINYGKMDSLSNKSKISYYKGIPNNFLDRKNGNTLYVGGDGPGNYTKIQDAIDNASDDDTVFVYSGFYQERLYVNKAINLIGENRENTIIDGGGHGREVVWLASSSIRFSGFTIRNSLGYSDSHGIYTAKKYTIIENCIITSCVFAIHFYRANDNIIQNNFMHTNYFHCIWFHESNNNTIDNNTILRNSAGICLIRSNNNVIRNNCISRSNRGGNSDGIYIASHCKDNIIQKNNILDNEIGITIGGTSDPSDNNVVEENNIYVSNKYGIRLRSSSESNKIQSNNFIMNSKNAFFENSYKTIWRKNYWDDWIGLKSNSFSIFPKLIFGRRGWIGFIPWINFDWHPAQEPYDIGV